MEAFIKKGDLAWLELALKDECIESQYLGLIHVIDGRAYATDGHRLHAAPCDLENAAYCRYELQRSLEKNNIPPIEKDAVIPKGFNPKIEFLNRARKAFNPTSQTTASNFYVQGGFYGQLMPKDGSSRFKRIYVLEALFGLTTKGETILHVHTKDDGENFMYANDGERSFVVMGMRLDKESNCGKND